MSNTNYQVQLDEFSGPLEKLLQLCQDKKIEIDRLGLANVTQDFVDYVESLQQVQPSLLADFVQTASRLLLIKSKALLPNLKLTQEEEADISDLEQRLQLYKNFSAKPSEEKNASSHVKDRYDSAQRSFGRSMLQQLFSEQLFYPPSDISGELLNQAATSAFSSAKDLLPKNAQVKIKLTSLEDKMKELEGLLKKVKSHNFSQLKEGKDKQEVVVLFLAILHLFAQKMLSVEQGEGGNIHISHSNDQSA